MPHDISLITTISAAFGLAMILGFLATRLGMQPLLGYLVAGIIIGPGTPGFVADVHLASQLAEIGVILLMFGVGLHFSLRDLLSVRNIAVPGAVAQISVATVMGYVIAHFWWDWTAGAALVFGLSLSCASTVVLLRALDSRGVLESMNGRIAVGWLIVEDLVMVLVLVLLPAISGLFNGETSTLSGGELLISLGITCAKVAAFIALMLIVGRRLLPWLLWQMTRTGSRELFSLCVIASALGVAYGSARLFDVSFALGAFFAGMMMRESEFSHRAADESLPLRDAFSVLFFVSVGMLFKPEVLIEHPGKVLLVIAVIMLGKTLAAIGLVLIFRYPLNTALTIGASLAQIGEFSFILGHMGAELHLLPPEGESLIVAGALISITFNPLAFTVISPLQKWLRGRSETARSMEQRNDPLAQLPTDTSTSCLAEQVVLVGYGRVGRRIADALISLGIPLVIVEQNRDLVGKLRAQNIAAVLGDAAEPAVLIQAHIAQAGMLIVATPDTIDVRKAVQTARALNPAIDIVLRTHSDEEATLMRKENLGTVFMGEHELALGMIRHVQKRMGNAQ